MELLEVKNLKTYFKTQKGMVKAVDGVSYSLDYGKVLGLVGESGCGKTTTALSIAKLLPPEGEIVSGEILLEGEDLLKLSKNKFKRKRWKDVSIIFQGAMSALNPVMKVGLQIAEALMLHEKLTYKQAMNRTKELFKLVEIDENRVSNYPHEFSGGMKQRVMIAMALACNPKVVIGDEPTTALDVMVQAQILNLLEKLKKEINMGLILITHDLSVLGEICDNVCVMYAGKIVENGTVEKIFNNHKHPYTHKLIKAFPNIHGERKLSTSIPGNPPNLLTPPSGCRFHPRCEFADEKCRTKEPELNKVGDHHFVACHYGGAFI